MNLALELLPIFVPALPIAACFARAQLRLAADPSGQPENIVQRIVRGRHGNGMRGALYGVITAGAFVLIFAALLFAMTGSLLTIVRPVLLLSATVASNFAVLGYGWGCFIAYQQRP